MLSKMLQYKMDVLHIPQEGGEKDSLNESIKDCFMIEVPSESCEILSQIVCY